jgi:hypothetical protein
MPYLKSRLGNVRNKPPLGGMVATDARVNHLMRWASEMSPRKMLDLLKGEFPRYDWQGALCKWFFTANCDDKMVLQYELAFGGTDWLSPFVDQLVVPCLASQFVAISVVPPNEGYDVFHMFITRWKPVVSLKSMMKKVLKHFMEKWTDGLWH